MSVAPGREHFGTAPCGTAVERVEIRGGGLTARVLSYGAVLQDLRLNGCPYPLVLGAESLDPYLDGLPYFGALVGRFANRISGGRFTLDGTAYLLDRNDLGKHCLHGGGKGTSARVWTIEGVSENSIRLGIVLKNGDMGFPGEMQVSADISLPGDGALRFDITAVADAATPCSFAHHSYFNLDGGTDIDGHFLQVAASAYLPADRALIPTGEIAAVDGTLFDFRAIRPIGGTVLDHNFCLSDERQTIRPVAVLQSQKSGLRLTVETTEPGLQVYTGDHIPATGPIGLDGRRCGPRAGVTLETQCWPDAPNRLEFPNAILRGGEIFRHRTRYVFTRSSPDGDPTVEAR